MDLNRIKCTASVGLSFDENQATIFIAVEVDGKHIQSLPIGPGPKHDVLASFDDKLTVQELDRRWFGGL